ncbi:unnamed protein product [Oreochromis niloticus]|nr:unnamed protein product [Mustela putorius furo]
MKGKQEEMSLNSKLSLEMMLDTDTPIHVHRRRPQFAVVGCFQVILFAMHIAQLIIGALNLHDCPRQPFIPIYLLVIGVVTLLFSILQCRRIRWSACSCLVSLFVFCWFIAGNVWIYSVYEPSYNKTASPDMYCNKTLYLFAFWTMNLNYILLGFLLFCPCCSCFFVLPLWMVAYIDD